MSRNIFISIALTIGSLAFGQNKNVDDFEFFYGYKDFLEDKPVKSKVQGTLTEISPDAFKTGTFKYKDSGKRAKPENFAWAIKYHDDYYLDMMNAAYIYSDYYVKADIVGKKYWVVFLDKVKDKKAIGYNTPYGGGVVGAALNMVPKSDWKDKSGNVYKVLLVDFVKPFTIKSRPLDNIAYLVDTKKILELTNNDPATIEKLRADKYTIEDFAEFINSRNQ